MTAAYEAFRDLANGLYNIDLTRYSRGVTSEDAAGTIPLAGLSKQIDRLLEGYCFQNLATNQDPEAHKWESHPDSHASYLDLG